MAPDVLWSPHLLSPPQIISYGHEYYKPIRCLNFPGLLKANTVCRNMPSLIFKHENLKNVFYLHSYQLGLLCTLILNKPALKTNGEAQRFRRWWVSLQHHLSDQPCDSVVSDEAASFCWASSVQQMWPGSSAKEAGTALPKNSETTQPRQIWPSSESALMRTRDLWRRRVSGGTGLMKQQDRGRGSVREGQ